MEKKSLFLLSILSLFILPGCGCKKRDTALKPSVTLGKDDKKKKTKSTKAECTSCTKSRKKDAYKKHAYIELDEAQDILI